MKPMQNPTRPRKWFLALATGLVLTALFLPELVGWGWHLLYGREASYGRWRIPVPTGWFASHHGDALTLERMAHLALWESAPTAVFLPMRVGPQARFDPAVWGQVQRNVQATRGYRLAAVREVSFAGQAGFCWEFVSVQNSSRWWITCLAPAERLSADFSGRRKFAETFYSILPRIYSAEP